MCCPVLQDGQRLGPHGLQGLVFLEHLVSFEAPREDHFCPLMRGDFGGVSCIGRILSDKAVRVNLRGFRLQDASEAPEVQSLVSSLKKEFGLCSGSFWVRGEGHATRLHQLSYREELWMHGEALIVDPMNNTWLEALEKHDRQFSAVCFALVFLSSFPARVLFSET